MALHQAPYLSSRDHGPSVLEPRLGRRLPPPPSMQQPRRRRRDGASTAALLGAGALAGGLLAWSMARENSR
jgi:hypothetical protein